MIYSLCYISTKRRDLLKSEINSIIETSKKRNEAKDISGILIEYKNHFIQHVEGDAVVIYELFEKIKLDSRHENVHLLQYSPLENRLFDDWNMAHRNLDVDIHRDQQFLKCSNLLDDLIENKSLWEGIKTIELMSNLINK
jgi:hypothetical protein